MSFNEFGSFRPLNVSNDGMFLSYYKKSVYLLRRLVVEHVSVVVRKPAGVLPSRCNHFLPTN